LTRVDLQKLAEKIRTEGSWKDGKRVIVFSEGSAHAIHDELIRLYKLEAALHQRREIDREIANLSPAFEEE